MFRTTIMGDGRSQLAERRGIRATTPLDASRPAKDTSPEQICREGGRMALEVIGAGFGRTGTNSLKLALEQLGLGPCHHMFEVRNDPEKLPPWQRAAAGELVPHAGPALRPRAR